MENTMTIKSSYFVQPSSNRIRPDIIYQRSLFGNYLFFVKLPTNSYRKTYAHAEKARQMYLNTELSEIRMCSSYFV